MSKQYKATLVRGESYMLGNKKFARGIPVTVSEEEKKKLQTNAVLRYTVQGADGKEVDIKQQFKFEEIKGAAAAPKSDKLKELEAMQGDGGVEFEDDAEDEDDSEAEEETDENASDDEYAVDEGDDTDEKPATPAPKKTGGGKGGKKGGRAR